MPKICIKDQTILIDNKNKLIIKKAINGLMREVNNFHRINKERWQKRMKIRQTRIMFETI